MDVLPHSTDVFEGPTHEEAIEGVKIRMEVEDSVEDIIRGVQDILYLELCAEGPGMMWPPGAVTGTCSHCHSDYYMVEQRCADTYEMPPDYLSVSWDGEVLCQSCQCDGKKCECCGVAEKLIKNHCDRNANFALVEGTFPPQYLCVECSEADDEIFMQTWIPEDLNQAFINPEDEETYRGEYEIDTEGDQSLLDDEETKKTKEMMKELMDEMFEVSSDISENTYMNIVNKMKQVYERL